MAGFMKSALNLFGIGKDGAESTESTSSTFVADYKDMSLETFLEEVVSLMGYSVKFSPKGSDGGVAAFEIEGDDTEEFLGDSSEMLESLAHLSMRFQRKKSGLTNEAGAEGASDFRVSFDAGDFRQRKIDGLRELAAQKRQKVLDASGKPAYINALGPAERKVIHTALTELGDVVSESIGNGYFKRIRVRLINDTRPARAEGGGGGGRSRDGGGGGRGRRGGGGGSNGGGRRGGGGGGGARRPEGEPNGNVLPSENFNDANDNAGNRLKPGEAPIFGFNTDGNADDSRN
jgi:predicted RNA-binding protein Jag